MHDRHNHTWIKSKINKWHEAYDAWAWLSWERYDYDGNGGGDNEDESNKNNKTANE